MVDDAEMALSATTCDGDNMVGRVVRSVTGGDRRVAGMTVSPNTLPRTTIGAVAVTTAVPDPSSTIVPSQEPSSSLSSLCTPSSEQQQQQQQQPNNNNTLVIQEEEENEQQEEDDDEERVVLVNRQQAQERNQQNNDNNNQEEENEGDVDSDGVPSDIPGAFPARGRAFGDFPVWGRGGGGGTMEGSSELIRRREGGDRVGSLRNVAEWISRRRMGSRTSSNRSRQSNNSSNSINSSTTSLVEADLVLHNAEPVVLASAVSRDHTKRDRRMFFSAFCCLFVVIVTLVVVLSLAVTGAFARNEASEEMAPRLCDTPLADLNVFDQCTCSNTTTVGLNLTDHELLQYDLINVVLSSTGFVSQTYPNTSCHIENQVMLWMANYRRLGFTPDEVGFATVAVAQQRFVLALLYMTMDGPHWTQRQGWLRDQFSCNWDGVSCAYLERISEVRLPHNGLRGTLPAQLGKMPFLRECIV